ncbi:hypothetical protein JX265_009180 [Neoarthrinium moseri]|uniref:Actin-like ATPase domain-containing protein n=1 Tax=Neoarthrinium moseri TaxID=1658444 RepID=A0A9P9WGU2_9PEZI|nr:uncharacterized protein JN550_011790 [Neoarthrinium moseri]KAI1859979.1 hypothetical protein JN550_011790 [Neoarthrinium moseri]KAI1862466.1 hypothetical protein JX265_009180 [Neoarthrinium moseri]
MRQGGQSMDRGFVIEKLKFSRRVLVLTTLETRRGPIENATNTAAERNGGDMPDFKYYHSQSSPKICGHSVKKALSRVKCAMAPFRAVNSNYELSDVTLGIDLGSTSTRAYLWCPETKRDWYIESNGRSSTGRRYANGNFSSMGYPFDGGEVYLGEKSDAARESISLKYAFYILVKASDDLFKQYQLAEPLRSHLNDNGLRDRLLEGLRRLFAEVYNRVMEVCQEEKLRVTTIGLSVPSQWTVDFMDLYRDIIAQVFKHDRSAIFFVTETEALAHFLCVKKLDRLVTHQGTVHHDVVLVLDFGGHNMVSLTSFIRAPSFYLIGKPDGAGGGSELWEYLVVKMSLDYLWSEYGLKISAPIRQKLLDTFNVEKGGCGPEFPGQGFDCCVKDQDGTMRNVTLDEPLVTACFDEAMKFPLALATSRIEAATELLASQTKDNSSANMEGPRSVRKPRIILAGGTARHDGLRTRIKAICQRNNLADPIITDNIINQYDSVKIACGAAFAVASPLTLQQFMERGAGFGLQIRQQATRDEIESEHPWDNTASFLFSLRRTVKNFEIYVKPKEELKIVCDPFFEDESNENKDKLHYHKCYDIANLGRPSIGYWWFTLSLTGQDNQMWLTIERSRKPPRAPAKLQCDPITVPLHYNRGSNSIHIGEEGADADEYILRLKHYPERDKVSNQGQKRKVAPLPEKRRLTARRTPNKFLTSSIDSGKAPHVLDRENQPIEPPISGRRVYRNGNDVDIDDREWSFVRRT